MDHREASLLLTEYIRGDLNPDQRRAVADHVAAHPECAGTLQFLTRLDADLSRHGRRLLDGHPTADALVAHAVGDATDLEPAEREVVAAHVAACAACFGDLQMVRRVHAELVTPPVEAGAGAGRGSRRWLALGGALAAGLLLGVAIPRSGGEGEFLGGPVPVVRLSGSLRDGAVPEFRVPATAGALPFVVMWDPWVLPGATDRTALTIRLADGATGREVWRLATTIGEAWDAPNGVVSFLVPASAVGHGGRTLTISGLDGAEVFSSRLSLIPR